MKLFISWSGERSKLLAEALHGWIPKVINAVEPWLSADDIAPGSRWSSELANQLEKTSFGVICLTRENLIAPWILFEAGALSKFVDIANVVPFLLDNKPSEIQGPLAQFQSLQVNKANVSKLLVSINKAVSQAGERSLSESSLIDSFDVWWSRLETKISDIPKTTTPKQASMRSERDVIDEILVLVRGLRQEIRHSSAMSDAEQAIRAIFNPKYMQSKEFKAFVSSLSEEDKAKLTDSMFSMMLRDRILDKAEDFWHKPLMAHIGSFRFGKKAKDNVKEEENDNENSSRDTPSNE